MSIEITDAMVETLRRYLQPTPFEPTMPKALAAVLALPEVRRAVVADMPTDDVMEALHASSYVTPEEAEGKA